MGEKVNSLGLRRKLCVVQAQFFCWGELMSDSVSGDLIRGNIDTIILCVLMAQDQYGYEIIKAIRHRSDDEYEMKEPTLYASLRRLEKQKMIQSYWGDENQGGRRKYYRLTEQGNVSSIQSR